MAQEYKVEKVEALKAELKDYHSFIFTNYRGLNVQQINDLRNNLRDKGAHYHVIKNRYAKRVFQDLGFDGMDQYLVDPTALAYFEEDLSEVAKVLIDSARETTLELKGGYSDGSLLSYDELIKISKLPSRDILLAQLLGMLNTPKQGLVTVLHGILSKFVRTLKAVEEVKPREEAKAQEAKAEEAKPKAEAKKEEKETEHKEEVKAEEAKPKEVAKAEKAKPKAEAKKEEKETGPKAEAKAEKEAKPKEDKSEQNKVD